VNKNSGRNHNSKAGNKPFEKWAKGKFQIFWDDTNISKLRARISEHKIKFGEMLLSFVSRMISFLVCHLKPWR
jgi:hypothetical protein